MAHSAPDLDPADVGPLLGGLSAPLAAISTRAGEISNAQIAVAITAASIVPQRPRLIVQIYRTNYTHGLIASAGVLAINFLESGQLPLIWELGMHSGRDGDKLAGVSYTTGATGSPASKQRSSRGANTSPALGACSRMVSTHSRDAPSALVRRK